MRQGVAPRSAPGVRIGIASLEPGARHGAQYCLSPGCKIICYADDTLVLAGEKDWGKSFLRREVAAHAVARSIREAELNVTAKKTRALFFYQRAQGLPPLNLSLFVDAE